MSVTEGMVAQDFSLPDAFGEVHRLSDYRGQKVVLYFYPRDNTPGCTQEACGFRDAYQQFRQLGAVVLGISTDSVSSHSRFAEKFALPFTILSDEDHVVAEAYGSWGPKKMAGRSYMGIFRKTFVIDESGTIVRIFPKVKPELHAQEVLQILSGSY